MKEERADEYTQSPVLRRIFERGWEAFEAGEARVSPYSEDSSGTRWRTFDNTWIVGYDEAATCRAPTSPPRSACSTATSTAVRPTSSTTPPTDELWVVVRTKGDGPSLVAATRRPLLPQELGRVVGAQALSPPLIFDGAVSDAYEMRLATPEERKELAGLRRLFEKGHSRD